MEEFDLKDLLSYFLNKLNIIVITTLSIVLLGWVYVVFIQTPMYTSYTTLVLTRVNEDSEGMTTTDITVNSKLVGTYSKIIKSNRIMTPVINELNLDYSVEELKNIVKVTNEADTELIKISVSTDNASLSCDIVNKIAEIFSQEIVDIYSIKNLTIIDKAEVSSKPSNVNFVKHIIIFFVVGLMSSLIIILVMYYFDNKIKSVEEVEQKIGLPILGAVPNRSYKGKKKSRLGGSRK